MIPIELGKEAHVACELEEAVVALGQLNFVGEDEDKVVCASEWLSRLIANRIFLADILLDRLTAQGRVEIDTDYSPQAIVLSPVTGGVFLRANIWPAPHDLCLQTSGAHNFVYGTPHDHNFSFLTGGYAGPGYVSDHYEYTYDKVIGYPGEWVDLRHTGCTTLSEGTIQLYRAHRDVHVQHPPESMSISLNVLEVPQAQGWFDQYEFDVERGQVRRLLSSNAAEVFLRVAVASGSDDAVQFAEWVGKTHPSERLRLASFEARAGLMRSAASRDAIWREAEGCGSRMVAVIARERRKQRAAG